MKKLSFLISFICVLLSVTGCGDKRTTASEDLQYSPYVEAFTSGKISRYSPVYLILSEDIPEAQKQSEKLSKQIHITPEVKGKFSLQDNRTVVFQPADGFERNTSYRVTADLGAWFDIKKGEKDFTFTFSTLPANIRAHLEALDINPKNENGYDITCVVYTADKETPEVMEKMIASSEKAEARWQHGPEGKKHVVTYLNVPAGNDKQREMTLTVRDNKQGYATDGKLLSVQIPRMNDFSVYDIEYQSSPERFIEVTFTRALDETQNMEGLAYIAGNSSTTVNAEGNKLRLYPDQQQKGNLNVHLDKGIRSKSGLTLEKSVVRQVRIDADLPSVEFVGEGVIIPPSAQLTVPFRAVYLRGVTVRVIKIFQQNIGQFLQSNDLDGWSNLSQVGRLVAYKTILLDEDPTVDLSRWNTYALDLRQLMEPEPGAIYRVELSFSKELSAYPCGEELPKLSAEELAVSDKLRFQEEISRFDDGAYYYNNGGFNWSDYNYEERNDPCRPSYYFNKGEAKNVLATNIGLIAMAGENNSMIVLAHNILSTNPEQGVKVTLYNYQHQEVGTGVTDNNGRTEINLTSGKPFYLIASLGAQRSYLRVDEGSALSLSSFDVSGEVVQKGIKGFIYGDRGVWRPGDTLHVGFMLNDRAGTLPENHPVVAELYNPLGQLYLRKTETHGEMGLYTFDMATEPDAPTGAWNVQVSVGGVTFSKRLRIEAIKPNRLKIALSIPEKVVLRGEPLDAKLHVQWLQGATARNLKYEIQGTFISTPTVFKKYKDFHFDDPSKVFNSEESKLITGRTNDVGDADIQARIEIGNSAPGMLLGSLVTRVYEESGDFSIDATRLLYSPYKRYTGIWTPQKGEEQLNTGQSYTYKVASVDYLGNPQPGTELQVDIYKVSWYWWWDADRSSMLANYVSDSHRQKERSFTLTTDAQGLATFNLKYSRDQWGTYFIRVKDKNGTHSSGILSYFDWPDNEGRRNLDGSDAVTKLVFKTDKDTYTPGEEMVVTFPSSEGSRAIVSIENATRVLSVSSYSCKAQETSVKLKVTPDMQPNAYVYITLLQPHALTQNDLPIRMYGVVPFTVTSPESHLNPVIQTAAELKPEAPYEITVSEKNGKTMAYTLAVVDEGLLDLTHFPTPAPWKAFNAHEALGVRTWDLYNYIVGAYGGRIEQLFSIGGDDALNKGPKAIVNRFKPVVVFDGPFVLKKGEKQRHKYTMPNYNGRVRIMVVAGNGEAYGDAEKSVLVRKPVMLLGTLPRVIGVGEEMVIPATVFATVPNVGGVKVSISCSSNMEVVGTPEKELTFTEPTDKEALFRIRVKDQPGTGTITLTATGKEDKAIYATEIEIRSVRMAQTRVIPVTLMGGQSWKEDIPMPGAEGTNSLTLEMSNVAPLDLKTRLDYLLGYPHGCLEQIVSKAFPQLYLPQLADLSDEQKQTATAAVKETINRLRSYQTAEGAFSYWPGQTGTTGWGTVYAAHFLLEAEAHGYYVPEGMKRSLLQNLQKVGREWKNTRDIYTSSEELTQAYRLYVLTLAQTPEVGAMNRMKETPGLSGVTRWMLAAAYVGIGRQDVAEGLITKTEAIVSSNPDYDLTYGSPTRNEAIKLMTLCLLGKEGEAAQLAQKLSKVFSSDEWLSTQSTSFGIIALAEFMEKYKVSGSMEFSYIYARKTEKVSTSKNFWAAKLGDKLGTTAPLEIKNTGKTTLFARIITEGIPLQGEEKAYSNGISLAVSYIATGNGSVNIADLQQGTNFTSVVTVKNPTPAPMRNLVLTQVFPAGWEILNTRFLNDSTATDRTPAGISYQDIRDDRVYSYIDNLPSGRQVTVRINLAAVYPGIFYLPPVRCEAMYNHLIQANTAGEQVEVK